MQPEVEIAVTTKSLYLGPRKNFIPKHEWNGGYLQNSTLPWLCVYWLTRHTKPFVDLYRWLLQECTGRVLFAADKRELVHLHHTSQRKRKSDETIERKCESEVIYLSEFICGKSPNYSEVEEAIWRLLGISTCIGSVAACWHCW